MMKKIAMQVRSLLLAAFANPGVFVVTAFTVSGMFTTLKLSEFRGLIELNVLVPWGLALAMLRLYRARERGTAVRRDVLALLILFGWLVVPFGIRFGLNSTNINTWQNFAIIFFGLFALMAEMNEHELAHTLDASAALSALVSFLFAGALLYCAVTVTSIRTPYSEFGFGVFENAQLCAEQHYNATGMLAMCGTFMCLMGVSRAKRRAIRIVYLIPAVMAALVVILTQSRTARYSLLAGLAVGAYGIIAGGRWNKRLLIRQTSGLLAGAVVLAGGYAFSTRLTNTALTHYAKAQADHPAVSLMASAIVKEKAEKKAEEKAENTAEKASDVPFESLVIVQESRGAGEGTFSGRTQVWKNVFALWKANPKYFIIGNGVGRTSRAILHDSPLMFGGPNMAHNAFIQFTLDHGLIGLVLMCAFLCLLVPPALRMLLAAPGMHVAGGRAMCMMTVACLCTAMMENEPLNAMRPCNVMLFFALAVLAHTGTKIKNQ